MRVGAVASVVGTLIVDKRVGCDVFVDHHSWHTDTKAREVVCDVVLIREAGEGDAVVRRRDVDWWGDVVRETSVLVEVDDEERAVPVLTLADGVVEVSVNKSACASL